MEENDMIQTAEHIFHAQFYNILVSLVKIIMSYIIFTVIKVSHLQMHGMLK